MIRILDGPLGKDDWPLMNWDTEEITYDESGGRKPFSTKEVIFDHGKYAGLLLSDVTNTSYLKFLLEKNKDDYLITYAFNKRLGELKI